jgi:hypothetical protein
VISSYDTTVILWDVDVASSMRKACAIANRTLTQWSGRCTWGRMFNIWRPVRSCRCLETDACHRASLSVAPMCQQG